MPPFLTAFNPAAKLSSYSGGIPGESDKLLSFTSEILEKNEKIAIDWLNRKF